MQGVLACYLIAVDVGPDASSDVSGENDDQKNEERAEQTRALLDGSDAAQAADDSHQASSADQNVNAELVVCAARVDLVQARIN